MRGIEYRHQGRDERQLRQLSCRYRTVRYRADDCAGDVWRALLHATRGEGVFRWRPQRFADVRHPIYGV